MAEPPRAWTFLVARGRRRGYRTLLAPDFLVNRGAQGILAGASYGDGLERGHARTVELDEPETGVLTVCYRTEQLHAADLAPQSGAALDQHGRPLELLYGVVVPGRIDGEVPEEPLLAARDEALHCYRRFLADEDGCAVAASHGAPLRNVRLAVPKRTETVPARPVASRSRAWRAAAAAAVAVLALLVVWRAWPTPPEPPDVSVTDVAVRAGAAKTACDGPVALELSARIRLRGADYIDYRWRARGAETRSRHLRLTESRTVRIEDRLTAPRAGRVKLVIARPRRLGRWETYDIPCADPVVAPAVQASGTAVEAP